MKAITVSKKTFANITFQCYIGQSKYENKFKNFKGAMKMEKQTVTIYDVAREAQVSMATVSRVVNGNTNVKP